MFERFELKSRAVFESSEFDFRWLLYFVFEIISV